MAAVKSWDGHLHIETSHGSTGGPSSPEPKSTDFWTEIETSQAKNSSFSPSLSKTKEPLVKPAEMGSSSLMAGATSLPKKTATVAAKKPVSVLILVIIFAAELCEF